MNNCSSNSDQARLSLHNKIRGDYQLSVSISGASCSFIGYTDEEEVQSYDNIGAVHISCLNIAQGQMPDCKESTGTILDLDQLLCVIDLC